MTEEKCEYYDNGKCDNFDLSNYSCDDSDNCVWYQHKRLEQERDELKQENKELKEFKKEVLKPVILPNIEEEVTNKYRSALEEIRKKVIHASTQWDSNEYNMIIRELVRMQDYIEEVLNEN